jgi:gamma-glutamylcyclotransferase
LILANHPKAKSHKIPDWLFKGEIWTYYTESMALIFQYGSNCSNERINCANRMQGDALDLGWAETVDNYQLQFDVWSAGNGCAASDVVSGGDSPAQGVLYEVPDALVSRDTAPVGRRSFDSIEGDAYVRKPIKVRKRDGTVVDAQTYVVQAPRAGLRTSLEYVTHIVRGLREHDADQTYISKIKDAAAQNNPDIAEAVSLL